MKKFSIIAIVLLTLLGAGGWFGRPVYRSFKERRLLAQARTFLAQGDLTNAWLSVRLTLQTNPTNLEASTRMAEFAEQARSPYAVVWRKRVAELDPTLTNRLLIAAAALRFEKPPFPVAAQALHVIGDTGRSNAAFHVVSSALALKLNRLAEAEQHLTAAALLEPASEVHQLNLAVVQLRSGDPGRPAAARARLLSLREHATLGELALRSLTADSLQRNDLVTAEQFSAELLARTNVVFSDRTMRLAIMRELKRPDFSAALVAVEKLAVAQATHVAELCSWLNAAGLAADALAWVASLPADVRLQPPVPVAVAECYLTLADWKGLEAQLQSQSWGEQEFLRLALRARARERQDDPAGGRLLWQKATRLVAQSLEMTALLAQLADGWGWKLETEELLWSVVRKFPGERWAALALEQFYYGAGNTRSLHRLYTELLKGNPENPVLKNNLAMFCLLLRIDPATGRDYAREVYHHDPNNLRYRSTYAFSLYVEGKHATALQLLDAVDATALAEPATAAYYGVILAANGDAGRAAKYLALAESAPLLPEEKALIARARAPR